jgi:hypothetical protein
MASRSAVIAVALFTAAFGGRVLAQEAPAPEPPKPTARRPEASAEQPTPRAERGPTATLRVQLVLSRYQGEKKTGSLPYTFTATAGGDWTRMRMGVDTPVPIGPVSSTKGSADGAPSPPTSYQYRNVGTNIDCRAIDRGDGRYELVIRVENSSALGAERAGEVSLPGAPLFRRFEANIDPVLRDGQWVQAIASADPVTGEVVKIDVTLNVVK